MQLLHCWLPSTHWANPNPMCSQFRSHWLCPACFCTLNICLTFCRGRLTLSLCRSCSTSLMLKLPSPFLSASVKVCFSHVMARWVKVKNTEDSGNLLVYRDFSPVWCHETLDYITHISPRPAVQLKDIGLGCAASWPGCPHRWCLPSDIWDLWSRCGPPLQCLTLGPGTPCALHSTDWNSSWGRSCPLHSAGRSQTAYPHTPPGANRWRLLEETGSQLVSGWM